MQALIFIRRLSQPLKSLYVLLLLSFPLMMALVVTGAFTGLGLAVVGVTTVATGITMLLNVNRAADTAAAAMKEYRPGGVDYSASWYATPAYARVFGAFATVVGGGFLYAALIER